MLLISQLVLLVSQCNTRVFSVLTGGFELITRRFELVTRRFELVTRKFELVTRNACFTFPENYKTLNMKVHKTDMNITKTDKYKKAEQHFYHRIQN